MRIAIRRTRPRLGIFDSILLALIASIFIGFNASERLLSFVNGLSPPSPNYRFRIGNDISQRYNNFFPIVGEQKLQSKRLSTLQESSSGSSSSESTTATIHNSPNDSLELPSYTKSHSLSVCLVPPSPPIPPPFHEKYEATNDVIQEYFGGPEESLNSTSLWKMLTTLRLELKDPGFYRWPPHVNLLYPFVNYELPSEVSSNMNSVQANGDLRSILVKLRKAASQIEPFWVQVDLSKTEMKSSAKNHTNATDIKTGFGVFGNSNRGVLWVYPQSYRNRMDGKSDDEPIVALQSQLENEFPMCSESLKTRSFLPHMTLSSKFDSVEDAFNAESELRNHFILSDPSSYGIRALEFSFWCKEFYLLERDGGHGQFQRRATISLGNYTNEEDELGGVCIHDPPLGYDGMPRVEEDWVVRELQILKEKRKVNRKKTNRARGTSTTRKSYRARKRERKKAEAQAARGVSTDV